MRSSLLVSATALFLTAAACSNTAPTVPTGEGGGPGTGGSSSGGSTGSGGANSGGTTGSGGSSSGGSTGEGGSTASGGSTGSGGATASGGATGSGGATASGGTTGNGGASVAGSTGSGGSSVAGSTGSGGSSVAGSTGKGGSSSGGSTGSGGSSVAGSTGSGGAGGAVDLTSVAASFDGQLLQFPCGTSHSGYDCDNVGCTNGAVTHTMTYPIKGTTGAIYSMTFNVRGIVEAYAYVGGTRAAGTASVSQRATNGGLFCSGGTQEPSGSGNDYNTYELDVSPGGGRRGQRLLPELGHLQREPAHAARPPST